jgi:hypothetical protein
MDIAERLSRCVATSSNDDMTEPRTEKRSRHTERVITMLDAIDEIKRLRAERDHWRGLVPRADAMQFPFEERAHAELEINREVKP